MPSRTQAATAAFFRSWVDLQVSWLSTTKRVKRLDACFKGNHPTQGRQRERNSLMSETGSKCHANCGICLLLIGGESNASPCEGNARIGEDRVNKPLRAN
jgi:hypothetical protein